MFDARYAAFAAVSALLVLSPGATLAVVLETALGEGRRAALLTVLGVGIGNATLALASASGMAWLFHQWPATLQAVRIAGAVYLTFLGLRGVQKALAPGGPAAGHSGSGVRHQSTGKHFRSDAPAAVPITRGILTNLFNPSVVLFYMTLLPQFIGPQDPVLLRYLLLGATHVAMSLVWQGTCGLTAAVAADRLARPGVRRTLEGTTGVVLVALGIRLLW